MKNQQIFSIFTILIILLFCNSCGPHTLRNLDNVIEDLQFKKVDSIVVEFRQIKNQKIIMDTVIIKENNDSINRLIEKKMKLIISKNNSVNSDYKDSLFSIKSHNKFMNDSLIIRIVLTFENTVYVELSVANFYKGGLDIYSDKYSPNAYEFFVFPFMGKGFIRYADKYKENPSFVMEDIIDLSNELIDYYNFMLKNKERKRLQIEK